MAIKTHYLIFSRESAFDLGSAWAFLAAFRLPVEHGEPRPPDRVDVQEDEAKVYFGPKYLHVSTTPLVDAVALLHRTIKLDDYTEADQYVYKPGHALKVAVELDHDNDPSLFWCFNPETLEMEYDGDEDPVCVRDPDEEIGFALVNHFPPAVFLMGSENPETRLCFPSEPEVRDAD